MANDNHLLLKASDRTHGGREVRVWVRIYSGDVEEDVNNVYFTVDGFYASERVAENSDLFSSVDLNRRLENERLGAQMKNDETMLRYLNDVRGKRFLFSFEYSGMSYSCIFRTERDSESVRIGSVHEIDVSSNGQVYGDSIEKSIKNLSFVVA